MDSIMMLRIVNNIFELQLTCKVRYSIYVGMDCYRPTALGNQNLVCGRILATVEILQYDMSYVAQTFYHRSEVQN